MMHKNRTSTLILTALICTPLFAASKKLKRTKPLSIQKEHPAQQAIKKAENPQKKIESSQKTESSSPLIRILVWQQEIAEPITVSVSSQNGMTLQGSSANRHKITTPKKQLSFDVSQTGIHLANVQGKTVKFTRNQVVITPHQDNLTLHNNDRSYQGTLTIHYDTNDNKARVINTLPLEDYVYAVLPQEAFQFWPLEMQKVQAIATRTYALHYLTTKYGKKGKKDRLFDLNCNNFHQTYKGTHPHTHLQQAVDETRGMVLTHKKKPIIAMFDACCAGAIPAKMSCHNFTDAPYLARKQKCTFCKTTKLFTWQREMLLPDFVHHLNNSPLIANKIERIAPLTQVNVSDFDRAGLVKKMVLKSKKGVTEVTGPVLHDSLRRLFRSLTFNVKRKQNKLVFKGHGLGHQTGLCQYGARELVRRGWKHSTILGFYYPGTKLEKMNAII